MAPICDAKPKMAEIAMCTLLQFVSTYLCDSSFSTLLQIKTKQRSRLEEANDLHCALSSTPPNISELAKKKQPHVLSNDEMLSSELN